jgi:hypothetical protein
MGGRSTMVGAATPVVCRREAEGRGRAGLLQCGQRVNAQLLRIDFADLGKLHDFRGDDFGHGVFPAELVAFVPEVILVQGTPATQALRDATRTIPIVFVNLADPVDTGIVSNLARPEATNLRWPANG